MRTTTTTRTNHIESALVYEQKYVSYELRSWSNMSVADSVT